MDFVGFRRIQTDLVNELYKRIPYGMVSKYGKHNGIKYEFNPSWMTDRAPYNIVCLDYLVNLVYITTGSIGGNGSIRLPVVSVVSGCCRIS